MFEYEFKRVNYVNANGDLVGTEIQIRSRSVTTVLGVLSFGAWSSWGMLTVENINV